MKRTVFRGSGVALVTPMRQDFSVDYEALGRLVCSDTWYFAAAVPTGAGIEAGARVSLDFGGFTAGARVLYAGEASGGERAVVFSVTEKLGEALYERICEAEIILDS